MTGAKTAPAESAYEKGLVDGTIRNDAVHLVGPRQSLASDQTCRSESRPYTSVPFDGETHKWVWFVDDFQGFQDLISVYRTFRRERAVVYGILDQTNIPNTRSSPQNLRRRGAPEALSRKNRNLFPYSLSPNPYPLICAGGTRLRAFLTSVRRPFIRRALSVPGFVDWAT